MKGYRRSLLWGAGPWLGLNPCRDSCLRHHGLAESLPQLGVREESFPATLVIGDLEDSLKFLSPYIFLLIFTCRQLYYLLLPLHALFNLKHTIGQASRNILCESLIIRNRDQSPLILGYFFSFHVSPVEGMFLRFLGSLGSLSTSDSPVVSQHNVIRRLLLSASADAWSKTGRRLLSSAASWWLLRAGLMESRDLHSLPGTASLSSSCTHKCWTNSSLHRTAFRNSQLKCQEALQPTWFCLKWTASIFSFGLYTWDLL